MIKAVIFDMDGTLIDSNDFHARAWQEILAKYGHEVTFEQVRHQIGKGGDQLMPVFLSEEEVERDGERIEEERTELFKREYLPRIERVPDDPRTLRADQAGWQAGRARLVVQGEGARRLQEDRPHRRPDRGRHVVRRRRAVEAAPRHLRRRRWRSWTAWRPRRRSSWETRLTMPRRRARRGWRRSACSAAASRRPSCVPSGCIAIFRDPADLLARYDESPLGRGRVAG